MTQGSVRKQAVALFGGAMLGAVLAVAVLWLSDGALTAFVPGPAVLPLGVLIYLLCIVVHEAGHLAGGALVGFRPLLFIAGPLRIERKGGHTRFGLNRSIALSGGIAICRPVGTHDLRRRTLIMAAGGPTASLLLGVQSLALWLALSPFLVRGGAAASLLSLALIFTGIGSLGIGIITLLPMRTAGFYSDGARILRLMRDGPETEREVALITLTGLTLGGARPRDWDAALVRRCSEIRDGDAFEVGGLQFAHAYALDTGDIDGARSYLEAALARVDQLPAGVRGSVQLGAAVFFALYDRDAVRARACLDAAGHREGLISTPHQRLLAHAAVRFAEGDTHSAGIAAREARRLMAHAVDRGSVALDDAHAERILSAAAAAP